MNYEAMNEAHPALSGFAIRTAGQEHHVCAQQLVNRRYADRGYINSLLSSHHEDAVTVCSAFQGERTVGTIAVRFESSPRGLNADAIFMSELADLRSGGATLCEFSRLAVDHDARDNKHVLARLFHLAYLHAYRLAGCELLVIEVNPRHVAFYRRMLGFKVCSESRLNQRVNAQAVLLSLDLKQACAQIAAFGGQPDRAATTRLLYPYFYSPAEETALLAKLRQ